MDKKIEPSCASCVNEVKDRICLSETGKGSKGCPTLISKEILKKANLKYEDKDIFKLARQASIQEADCYSNRHEIPYIMQPSKTRIVEICEFAQKMEYSRIGVAFCIGLHGEVKTVESIFQANGFEVVSVCCKAGRTSKDLLGIEDKDKVFRGTDESMCNPIFQAEALNEAKVDLNVLLGLCVGHDVLFFQHSKIPTTVLAVKDRVTGHNPLAAIYNADSYYQKIKKQGKEKTAGL